MISDRLAVLAAPAGPGTERGEVLRAVVVAGLASVAILAFAPPPGDAAAHLYRTWLVDQGVLFWDTMWFGGHYPIATYSPLYYFLAAVIGNTALSLIGLLCAAGCFGALAMREWGLTAVWPARFFGLCAAGPMITGTAPYGLGLAAALATLLALQRGRRWVAAALAVATIAFSALAFFFLGLALGAVALSRRCGTRDGLIVGAGMVVLAACWLVSMRLVPTDGRYPFAWWTLVIVVAVSGCGLAIALQAPRARLLAAFFGLWMFACVTLYLVPTSMGEIVTRLRYLVFPLMLLTVLLAGMRPRWLAITGLTIAAAYNLVPYAASVAVRMDGDGDSAEAGYWLPIVDFLEEHRSPEHLVEVVSTGAHWEAYYLPREGIPLVRGWFRQTDMVRNKVLYEDTTTPAQYLNWLHENAVRFVVLPDLRLDAHTGEREARLVRDRATGLVPVLRTDGVTVYEVPGATPLLTGPAAATVTGFTHSTVSGTVDGPGEYELRLQWSPYWRVLDGEVTLRENRDTDTVRIRADGPGGFRLGVRAYR